VKEQGGSVKDFTGDRHHGAVRRPEALEDAPLRACAPGCSFTNALLPLRRDRSQAWRAAQMRMALIRSGGVTQMRGESAAMDGARRHGEPRLAPANPRRAGNVYLSEATQRSCRGWLRRLRRRSPIKGKAEPQKVYRLDSVP